MPDSALLIGNNGYGRASLTNAVHDATDLAEVLEELGFSVRAVTDADHETMDRAIDAFLDGIPQDGTALFYFSGHGLQIEGGNYLLPVGFRARDRIQAKHRACSAEEILGSMEQSSSRLNIVVLDACRDNPFRAVRGATKGLAVMPAGAGSIIAYATGAGMTAADNPEGRNGLYTTYLIEALRTPGLKIEDVFKRTTEGVVAASGREQIPWMATCVVGEHVLCKGAAPAAPPPAPAPAPSFEPEEAGIWREGGHAYDEKALGLYERVLSLPDWRRPDPAQNEHGMLEAVHERTGLTFVVAPSGSFRMGSPKGEDGRDDDEDPVHTVRVPAFLLSKTECTQAAWDRVGGKDERRWKGSTLPMEGVSWEEVKSWCGKAGLRLPSESEWEYACRAGSTSRWCFGDSESRLKDYGWYFVNSGKQVLGDGTEWDVGKVTGEWECRTHAVAGKRPNAWGLYDMHGNVYEWCQDRWHDSYEGAPTDGSAWTSGGTPNRVFRGGSWYDAARYCRSASRYRLDPGYRDSLLGFRPAFWP